MPSDVTHISLLKYNNYANRTYKPGDGWDEIMGTYDSSTKRYSHEIARIDNPTLWNPNDGVTTTIITPLNMNFSTEPDYCVLWSTFGTPNFESRWFVVETVRLQAGQYQCYLRRDVFAEAWNELMAATCHIDRAIAGRYSSLIFNSEPITVSQINTDEMLIKDKTGCPWIVFYGDDPDASATSTRAQTYDIATLSMSDWKTALNGDYLYDDKEGCQLTVFYQTAPASGTNIRLLPYGLDMNPTTPATAIHSWAYYHGTITYTSSGSLDVSGHMRSKYDLKSKTDYNTVKSYNNKILYDSTTGLYYKVTVTEEDHVEGNGKILGTDDLFTDTKYILENYTNTRTDVGTWQNLRADNVVTLYTYKTVTVDCVDISGRNQVKIKVPEGSYRADDSPYFIWCMPYGAVSCTVDGTTVVTDADTNLSAAMALSKSQSANKVWDFQIVPYCPLPDEFINNDGSITVTSKTYISTTGTLTDGNTPATDLGFVFAVPKASFTRQILLSTPITVDDPKFDLLTKTYRLYSPNYASSFEFSVAKNNGLSGFNIRCTYMPVTPYIRVTPIWGGLYGENEDEVRGLVLGGDYSMARVNDAWIQYSENNKNLNAIFNREIEHLDVQRSVQKQQEQWGIASGVLGGATSGAIAGSAAGPWGALAGAVVGGVGAGVTGGMDLKNSEKLFQENRSYATDMHVLQLGNIQAMPRTIARTTAFNVDNRYFPIFTTYSCTNDEERAVAQFILNRSMTIGVVDNPSHYVNNDWTWDDGAHNRHARGFIQGSIMWINTVHDTHFVDALNDEFSKGVYTR